jgi:hypothetical protein
MNNKYFLVTVAVLIIIAIGGYLFPQATSTVTKTLGVAAGPFHTEHQTFSIGSTEGGAVWATTTLAATHTFDAATLDKYRVLRFLGASKAAAITATLPATSTMSSIIPKAGDTRTWIIENGYGAAATTTTIAAGTGIDLQEPDGQNVVIGINNYAFLTCFREASSDIVCKIDETIPAD